MASSSSAGPGRGRGRPPKASKAASVADKEDAVDRLLSMIDDKAQSKESGQSEPSEGSKRPSKAEAKRVAKDKKIEAKTNPKDEKKKDDEKSEKKRRHDDSEKASAKVPKGPYEWPPDPQEARLTAAGAICDAQSRLQLSAYTDLRKWFQGEPSEMKHPDAMNPGLRQEELSGPTAVSLEGLHNWSDDKGAGWKTMRKAVPGKHKAESRWFGANSWGSWRMAFLLARLQRQVWQAATELQAVPAAAQEKPAEEPEKVLDGVEEWHMFSPKTIDCAKCLARTWNNGEGGQCQEAREDDLLCYKHQRMAVSKQGLLNGLVNGPIPEKRLREFQEAAVKGLGLGRKIRAPSAEDSSPKRSKGKRQKTFAFKEAFKKKRKKAKLKPQEVKIKEVKEAKEAKRTKDKVVGAATDSNSPKVPKKSERSDRNRTSTRLQDPNSKEGTLPPQKPVKESDLFGRKPKERERTKKSEDKKPQPEVEPQPQGEVRSRRFLAKMSDLEQQRRNQNKWSSVGDAMDKALDQIDAETQQGPLKSLVNAQGCIPMSSMAKAVEAMKTTPVDHRLQFAMVLRKTMLHTPASTNEFMVQGGVAGLRHWLKDALPSLGQRTTRKQELVVLECLGLLHEVPVTFEVLQSTGIGSTLMAIRNYVAPAMADAGELVAKWMKKFSKEIKRTKTSTSAPAASSSAPPPAMPSSSSAASVAATKAAAAIPRSGTTTAAPAMPSPTVATQVPPAAPAYVPPAPKRVNNFTTRMLMRKRERARNAQNEMEATLRELFRLQQVLEEDPPEVKTIDLRDLDID